MKSLEQQQESVPFIETPEWREAYHAPKHTCEPWFICSTEPAEIRTHPYGGDIIGHTIPNADNAHRIVACVNACRGMADPAAEIEMLKQVGIANSVMHLESVDAAAENATLRDQLARICEEGFGNDDTIGQEPADDYVLRKMAEMREAIRESDLAFRKCLDYILGLPYFGNAQECEATESAHQALRKLTPFLP